jgi:hypothetical protein
MNRIRLITGHIDVDDLISRAAAARGQRFP